MRSTRLVSTLNVASTTSCLRRRLTPLSTLKRATGSNTPRALTVSYRWFRSTATTMRPEVGGTDAEWDELLATSEIEIVTAQRLTPEEKLNQQRTDEFIDKLLSAPSGQLVKDMLYSAISTHKTLQEKHLFEALKRAKRQLGELQRTMPDGVVSVSNVAVYPPARAYLIFEASLDAGLVKMLCERERMAQEGTPNEAPEQVVAEKKALEEETPSGLSADEEQLFAMLLARKNASLNRQRSGDTTTSPVAPPTPAATIEDGSEEDDLDEEEAPPTVENTIKTNVLVRVSKIADTVLKLLLAPAIRNVQDEEREGSSGKVRAPCKNQAQTLQSDPITSTGKTTTAVLSSSSVQQQAEEDAAMAWRLLALMERKGLRVSSPKILSALRDYAHCGVEGDNGATGGGGKDGDQQQHVVTSQRLQFLEHEERRIQREVRRGGVAPSSEDKQRSRDHHASPYPEAVPRRR